MAYSKEIIAYLVRSGVAKELARDISQDVLLKMLESDLALPPEKIRAWMYRVAVRKYIDQYRRDKAYLDILQRDFFIKRGLLNLTSPTMSRSIQQSMNCQKNTAGFYRFITFRTYQSRRWHLCSIGLLAASRST